MNFPQDLKYTASDEWVRVEDGQATLGISDFAQDQLSDIVYLEITVEVGDEISKGDAIAAVESVKAAADVYSPLSGVVKAINDDLADQPELINSDPYGGAWIIRIEISESAELDGLMDSTAYTKNTEERDH